MTSFAASRLAALLAGTLAAVPATAQAAEEPSGTLTVQSILSHISTSNAADPGPFGVQTTQSPAFPMQLSIPEFRDKSMGSSVTSLSEMSHAEIIHGDTATTDHGSAASPVTTTGHDTQSAAQEDHAMQTSGHDATPGHAEPAVMPTARSGPLCRGFGPQTPRDISQTMGLNRQLFPTAPEPSSMNLCNIHTHTNAEHKGPGFSILSRDPEHGGFQCNESAGLSAEELRDPMAGMTPPFGDVKPGDTIEVHWVYTSCDVQPGEGLGSCMSESCANPTLRVESQVFLLVNDPYAMDFALFDYRGNHVDGRPQPLTLPTGTGAPVVFAGSTTGPKYTESVCSPLQVTWSVRPRCAKLDINSLYRWGMQGNVFNESHSHGVRTLVTAPELLAPIQ